MIFGGPGTGKTIIASEIIRNAALIGKKILCLALTGVLATSRLRVTTSTLYYGIDMLLL